MFFLTSCKTKQEIRSCPSLDDVKSIDQLKEIRLFEYTKNAISYFECAENKNKILDVCKKIEDERRCSTALATIHIMYLYKTNRADGYEIFKEVIPQKINVSGFPSDTSVLFEDIQQFLSDPQANSKYFSEFNLLKDINSENILQSVQDNKKQHDYFKNIRNYGKAAKLEDWKKITQVFDEEMNDLLIDACKLTFTPNKEEYCKNLISNEISACESSNQST